MRGVPALTDLVVSEIYGPTVQGEGPSTGQRCSFIRLGRCNLDCAWCDTPFTWDWTGKNGVVFDPAAELTKRPVADVVAEVTKIPARLVVISGGEPLLQRGALVELVGRLLTLGLAVEIETNGTQEPPAGLGGDFNVSPKLANSGVDPAKRYRPEALEALRDTGRARFKFVVQGEACLDEVDELVALHGLDPSSVWIMPEGRDAATLATHHRLTSDLAVERGYNITSRLHVLLWGNRRGV